MNAKNLATIVLVVVGLVGVLCAGQEGEAGAKKVKLTSSLVGWISDQSEGIVDEMEAIAKFNAETTKFSVVSYLRYLTLYDHLKVVAGKPLSEFKWIAKKAKTFARIYDSAMQIVFNYLQDVDQALRQIEDKEPKSKQVDPSADWIKNYDIIRFIALHAPEDSELAKAAKEMLSSSPNGTMDRARNIRYSLKTRAFSK